MKYISTIIFLSLGCVALCGYNRSINRSADTTTTDASTTLSSPTNNKMCYPILSNVKMYFSDKAFTTTNTGAKTSFTSRDFIYGRIEVNGQTLAEAFKLNAQPAKGFHYLNYGILITPKGKSENELNYDQNIKYVINNRSKPILIKAGDEKNTWLNFDVLPEPSGISTLQAPAEMPENINEFKFAAGMDLVTREDNIKTTFPSNGDYTIQLVLWNYSFDDWGKPLESEKNIITLGEFTYQFSAKDGATLMSNSQKRLDGVRLAQMMKNKYTKLPDWWHGKPFTPADAILSSANLTPMIKNYCSHNGLTYISHKVYPYNGAAGWTIYTDSQTGRQVSRRLNAEAWTLYKDENGRCRFAVALIDEQYAGAGTYGSPYISGLSGEFIECSAIK
ncbi:MAG: hypothetical protein QM731_24320 [Chitinophagaceae bacterium]